MAQENTPDPENSHLDEAAIDTPQPGARKEMPASPPSNTFLIVALIVVAMVLGIIILSAA